MTRWIILVLVLAGSSETASSQGSARSSPPPRSVTIQGVAVYAAGGPPPAGTLVEYECAGAEALHTTTAADGRFAFAFTVRGDGGGHWWSPGSGMSSGMAGAGGCRVQVVLDGVRSVLRSNSNKNASTRSPFITLVDLGTILLYPVGESGEASVSVTSLTAPSTAQKKRNEASKALSASPPRTQQAIELLKQAVEEYPAYAVAWAELGAAYFLQQDYPQALEALLQARDADPQYFAVYPRLAGVAMELRDLDVLASAATQWRQLRPGSQQAEYYLAIAYMGLGRFELAEQSAAAVANGPELDRYPHVLYLLGNICASRGEIGSAAGHFDRLLSIWPEAPMAAEVEAKLAEWEAEGRIQLEVSPEIQ